MDTVLIPLSRGKSAIVDAADYPTVSQFKWRAAFFGAWYAIANSGDAHEKHSTITMQKLLLPDCPPGMMRDHINRNGLDNRRANLRFVTSQQNTWNRKPKSSQPYKGVYASGNRWGARIGHNGAIYLGRFDSAEEAARAYDAKARELRGEYAYLNFPDGGAS